MPKITTRRNDPRQQPYSKGGKVPPKTTPRAVSQQSHFLELPLEIRLSIYDCFADVPRLLRGGFGNEDEEMLAARKAMMLICRQMTREWTPYFYRSTTIVVNTLHEEFKVLHGPSFSTSWLLNTSNKVKPTDFHNARQFGDIFLKHLEPSKLCNLRRLKYDASLWTRRHSFRPQSMPPYVDFQGLRDLGRVLRQHEQIFTSLEEVTLRETRWCNYSSASASFPAGTDQLTQAKTVWAVAGSLNGAWDAVARTLQGRSRAGCFHGWHVEKHVRAGFVTISSSMVGFRVVEVKLVFKRPRPDGLSTPVVSADDAVPQLEVGNWWNFPWY